MRLRTLTAVAVALPTALAAHGAAAAETINLHVISAQAPRMLTVKLMSEELLPEINRRLEARGAGYQIRWRESYAGVVAKAQESFTAIQRGIGDMGQVGTLFEGAKLPLSQVTFYTPFSTAELDKMLEVMIEVHQKVPEMLAAYERYGQMPLTLMGTDNYHLVTTFPVESLDDLEGRRIGVPGAAANWLKETGAVPVSTNIAEYYNNLRSGVYDGVIVFSSAIVPFKLYEVAPYVTRVDIGSMSSVALTINKRVWDGLPEVVREVMQEAAHDWRRQLATAAMEDAEGALAAAEKLGAKVSALPEEERRRWAERLPNIAMEWAEAQEAKGLPGRAVVSAYMDGLRARGITPLRDWDR